MSLLDQPVPGAGTPEWIAYWQEYELRALQDIEAAYQKDREAMLERHRLRMKKYDHWTAKDGFCG